MESVLLNGKSVKASEIDPARHRYIGRFRPAVNPVGRANGIVICTCGALLHYRHELSEHFNRGCFDLNQYVDITPAERE